MTSNQGKRKHNACLLRFKENCPFRRCRRNKFSDTNVPSVQAGARWANLGEQGGGPVVTSASAMNVLYVETHPQPSAGLPDYHSAQQEEHSAMDMDLAAAPTGPNFANLPSTSYSVPRPSASNIQPVNAHQLHLPPAASESSMELDSGVDPETGERAQG